MLLFCAKLIIFLLLCPTILFFLGRVLIGKHSIKLQGLELFYFSLVLGIFFIILQAVIFGLLKIRFLSLPLIIVTFLYSILRYRQDFSDGLRQIIKDKLLLILLLVGVVVMVDADRGVIVVAGYRRGVGYRESLGISRRKGAG